MRETTEIIINEDGSETHESWLTVRANRVQGRAHLFDSEIQHMHWVIVEVSRCRRTRDLNHDRIFASTRIMQFEMSQAQWGAFVSSFGDGTGVPATLTYLDGEVPSAPFESRLEESHKDVRNAADNSLAKIREDFEALETAFEAGEGKRALRERIRSLHYAIKNGPANMEFAAKSLTEHAENVVTKARADIEAMVLDARENPTLGMGSVPLLDAADEKTGSER